MAKINNNSVIQKLVDELNLQVGSDTIPTETADKVLPTFQINSDEIEVQTPPATIVRDAGMTNSSGDTEQTIYTTPSTGNFYLTSLTFSHFAYAHVGTWAYIEVTIDGTARKIARNFNIAVATYQEYAVACFNINFSSPIKIDPGTAIKLVREESNKGVQDATIIGYTTD